MNAFDKRVFLDKTFESSLDAIIFTDEKGYIIEANKAYVELTGYKKDEIIGKHTSEFSPMKEGTYECTTGELVQIDKKFSERLRATMKTYVEKGKLQNVMGYQLRKDHKIVPVEDTMVFLVDDNGERIGGVAVIRDNTKRVEAEIEIQKTKEYLENIFMTSVDGIIIATPEGKIAAVNKAIEKMFACSSDQLVGKHFNEMRFDAERVTVSGGELMSKLMRGGTISGVERTWKKPDGSSIDIELNVALLKDDGGNVTGAVAGIRDITGRKAAEAKLTETRDYLENIIESSLDGIVVSDNVGYITRVNKAFLNMLGYREEEIIGKHIIECSPLEEGNYNSITGDSIQINDNYFISMKTAMASFLHDGKVINRKTFYLTKDKKLLPAEESLVFLFDTKGDRVGAVGVIRDITERMKAEELLRESEEKYYNLIEHANDAIVSINTSGMIIGFNKKAEQMFGYSREEVIGKPSYLLISQQNKEIFKEALKQFAMADTGIDRDNNILEGIAARKGGEEFQVEYSYYTIDIKGEVVATSIIRDISERKEAENKLMNYQKQLKALTNKLISSEQKERQYFADFLHDEIGQQLFATRLQLEQLKGSLSSTENTNTLDNALKNLYQVMNQTRTLTTKLSSPILNQLGLEKALEWLAEETRKKYDIMVSFEDDKREKPLDDNVKILLYQSVSELLTNVAKHAQAKNVNVSIKKENTDVRICVEDNGVGFNPQSQDFFDAKITGFGLFRIRERLESLGGQIEIESQPNRGTKVTLVAPLSSGVENP